MQLRNINILLYQKLWTQKFIRLCKTTEITHDKMKILDIG